MIKIKNVEMVNEIENSNEEIGIAQDIFNYNNYTKTVDVYEFYTEREYDKAVTYKIEIDSDYEFNRFKSMLVYDGNYLEAEYYRPNYKEWFSGKTSEGQRLGKYLRKLGYSQQLLDFYSAQDKTERTETVYFTLSSLPSHIAGMSFYGDGWSSCQNTETNCDSHYPTGLIGSIQDSHLYIGFVHKDKDDTRNFIARSVFRYFDSEGLSDSDVITYDVDDCFISTTVYGDSSIMNNCLNELRKAGYNIFNMQSLHGINSIQQDLEYSCEGYYEGYMSIDVNLHDYGHVDVDCMLCDSGGYVWIEDIDRHITCPHCGGDGTVEEYIEHEFDDVIEEYIEFEYQPYAEAYTHYGSSIMIDDIDVEQLEQDLKDGKKIISL